MTSDAQSKERTWTEIRVKRGATCVACGERIHAGSLALKEVTFKAVKHVTCPRQACFASGIQIRRGKNEWVFHRAGCNSFGHLAWKDRISFATREEAEEFGCRPCKYCHP